MSRPHFGRQLGLACRTHLLGVILANRNDEKGAAEHMRAYLTLAPNAPDAGFVRKQIAELEKHAGK